MLSESVKYLFLSCQINVELLVKYLKAAESHRVLYKTVLGQSLSSGDKGV